MSTATATKNAKAAAPAATEVKISDAVNTLAGIYEKGIKIEDGKAVFEDGLIDNNLPEDVSVAQIKRMQKVRGEIVAAATLALSRKSMPVLAKNKALERIEGQFKIGNDKVDLGFERQREFNDGKGGKILKHGYVSIGYTATGATNAGEFKKVRQVISDEAKSLFGS